MLNGGYVMNHGKLYVNSEYMKNEVITCIFNYLMIKYDVIPNGVDFDKFNGY